jgi:hypothetical protein
MLNIKRKLEDCLRPTEKENLQENPPQESPNLLEKPRQEEKPSKENLGQEEPGKLNLPPELIFDWEKILKKRREEIEEEEKIRRDRITRAEKVHKSWELARICKEYIVNNSKSWKSEKIEREKMRKRQEEREEQKIKAAEKRETFQTGLIQKKILETLKRLPAREREETLRKNERERIFELREIKSNIWKKWRGNEKSRQEKMPPEDEKKKLEENLNKLEETLARVKQEEEKRKEKEMKRTQEYLARIKEKRKNAEEKMARIEKKAKLEESWNMLRWVTRYIEENQESWEKEMEDRQELGKEKMKEWEKLSRLEKIKKIRKEKVWGKHPPEKAETTIPEEITTPDCENMMDTQQFKSSENL